MSVENPVASPSEPQDLIVSGSPFQTFKVILIGFAHGAHDLYLAFVAPLLPVLIETFSLTKTAAGFLSILTQIPSLIQPLIGHLSDRINLKWIVILGPFVSAAFICLTGIAPTYGIIALCFLIAGISNAAFHAVGPVMAGQLSGDKLGRGMSVWMVGGEIARVLGPVVVVSVIGLTTLKGLPWVMIGGFLASVILYFRLRGATSISGNSQESGAMTLVLSQMKRLAVPMLALLLTRTFMDAVITTYLPTMLTDEGANLWFAGASLSIMEVAGVVGALLSGPISDRIGRKKVILASMFASPVFMYLFLISKGWLQIPFLMALGFVTISVTPAVMALILEHCSGSRALANGTYMAASFLIRAVNVLIIGQIADHSSLRVAFYISIFLVAASIPFVFMLPQKTVEGAVK